MEVAIDSIGIGTIGIDVSDVSPDATPDTGTGTATGKRRGRKSGAPSPYVNNTSRLRKYVCNCPSHIVNDASGRTAPGPYVVRIAGTGALVRCEYCECIFRLADEAPTRTRAYRGCAHCTNPDAHDHDHGIGDGPDGDTDTDADGDSDGDGA